MRLFRCRPLAFFALWGFLFLFLFLTLLLRGRLGALLLLCFALGALLLFALSLAGIRLAGRSKSDFFRSHPTVFSGACLFAAAALVTSLCMLFHCRLGTLRVPLAFRDAPPASGTPVAVEGEIVKIDTTSYSSLLEVNITRFDGEGCGFGATVTLPEVLEGGVGDRFAAEAVFSMPEENAGGFPLRQYYFSQGIFLQGEVKKAGGFTVTGHSRGPDAAVALFRERIAGLLDRRLSKDTSPLLRALLLGDRDPLPDSVKRDFSTLGISHLLAVSGLHLAVLLGMLSFLLQKLRLPKKLHFPFQALFCLFFMALCGFSGSVCRAGVMYLFALSAPLFKTRGDGVTGLFAGGLLILLFSPWRLFDTGLQLSFLAVLGILTVGRLLSKKPVKKTREKERTSGDDPRTAALRTGIFKKLGIGALTSLQISFAAILFTFPVSANLSGCVALLSPFATLLFAPLIEGLLLLSPPALLLSFLPGISDLLFFLADRLGRVLLFLSSGAVYFEKTVLPLDAGWLWVVCLGFFLLLAVLLLFKFSEKLLRRLPALLFLGILLGSAAGLLVFAGRTGLLYCHSGTNEAILLKSEGQTLLIDLSAGGAGAGNVALNRKRNLPTAGVDALLLTHLHSRHRTTLFSLAGSCYLKKLYLPLPEGESEQGHYTAIAEEAAHLGIQVIPYRRDGTPFSLTEAVTFTPAVYTKLSRSTHPAIAFRLDKGDISLLYAGSAFPAGALASLGAADADCLLLGLHGPIRKESDDKDYPAALGDALPAVILADGSFAEAREFFPACHLLPEEQDFLPLRFEG